MTDLKTIEKIGTDAVSRLRRQKLSEGLPFMINSKELLTNQCYLEYPNGVIELVGIHKSARDFYLIRALSDSEAQNLRIRYKFYL